MQQKGLIYIALERYEKANSIFVEALDLLYTQNKPLGKVKIPNNLGIVAALIGDNDTGLTYFEQAKIVFEQEEVSEKDLNGLLTLMNCMANEINISLSCPIITNELFLKGMVELK